QFALPFLLFNLFTGMHNLGLDRTAYPWGFYPSRILLNAVFFPEGLPHEFIQFKGVVRSKAYVGLLGTVVAAVILFSVVRKLVRRDGIKALQVSENPAWSLLFWAGVIALLIAMGIPFSPKWKWLLNHAGPFRQLRAVGRFVFPFYYTMSITSFLFLWRWYTRSQWRMRHFFLVGVMLFAGYESVVNVWERPELHANPIDWHSGLYNQTGKNEWYSRHNFEAFQAILPLPYFHIGSENYWVGDGSPVTTPAYAASIGTGLPLTAVMLSRTSINQTLMNLDLVMEPYHEYPLLDEFPDSRPLLIIRHKKGDLTEPEMALVRKSILLDENRELLIYSLSLDSIPVLIRDRQRALRTLVENSGDFREAGPDDTLSVPGVLYEDFSVEPDGQFRSEFISATPLFEAPIPDTGRYMVSFWFEGADRDLWPRTNFWNELYREDGSKYRYIYTDFFRKMVLRDGSWGLVEYPVHVEEPGSRLKISFRNRIITGGEMVIDRVLVRPVDQTHVVREEGQVWVNNRQLFMDFSD
ncbi:MAG: hypothetical protein ABFS10_12565, partial [Bacteroidota bacterium]